MTKQTKSYTILGLMSGTSLDGLDMALCRFTPTIDEQWKYEIISAQTVAYDRDWYNRLRIAPHLSAAELTKTDREYGHLIGQMAMRYISDCGVEPLLIASHGHTVFHQPAEGYTLQIGSGASIHSETKLPVVADFRSLDIALGGQGAPLVPAGEHYLFSGYDAFLNLGGFANVSIHRAANASITAFDCCACNCILNDLANLLELPFDKNGGVAASGAVNHSLLNDLNNISYYQLSPPKSLGREWIDSSINPLLNKYQEVSVADKMATFCEHIAIQIAASVQSFDIQKLLVSGGGAYNNHLIHRIQYYSQVQVVLADDQLIQFKEALIFAFLGLLRVLNKANAFSSVTGARQDSVSGSLYGSVEFGR